MLASTSVWVAVPDIITSELVVPSVIALGSAAVITAASLEPNKTTVTSYVVDPSVITKVSV